LGARLFFQFSYIETLAIFSKKQAKLVGFTIGKNSFSQKISNLFSKKSDKNCWKKSLVGRVENLRVVSGYPTSHKES
jgi:hypothetical protein